MNRSDRGQPILLVDDHVDLADALGEILAEAGHEVQVAYDADAAISSARLHKPAVAFLDYRIGSRVTGLELLADLRSINADIVCVVMTADSEQEIAIDALKAGVFDYIRKPADPLSVLSVAATALDHARRRAASKVEKQLLVEKATEADTTRGFMKSLGAEIREPLSLILGYAELLSPEKLSSGSIANQSEAIANIKESAALLLRAVGTAAELSSTLEEDEVEDPAPADISQLVKAVRDRTCVSTKTRGVQLEIAVENQLPLALVDKQSLRKLMCNVVEAAAGLNMPSIRLSASRASEPNAIVLQLDCKISETDRNASALSKSIPNGLNLAQAIAWRAGISFNLVLDKSTGFSVKITMQPAQNTIKAVA